MHRSRRTSHRYPRAALWVGGGLAVAALAWMVVGTPALVKYPTDLTASPSYEGTFTVLVDPATAAPLDEPLEVPLTVDRRIEAVGEESGASRVVVRETIEQRAGDVLDTTQANTYVMDRSSLVNVADDRAWAFEPTNVVDRSGAYRLNLPFDASRDATYEIYKNEIDATYEMTGDRETPTVDLEGLHLSNFVARLDEAPVSDAYLDELGKTVDLPESLTLDQLKPHLLAAGIDVDALLAALTPVLTPTDAATLAEIAARPVPLEYVQSFEGQMAVEPVTGAEIRLVNSESVGARPDPAVLPALQEVLGRYPDVPAAAAADAALDDLAAIPLFEYSYTQTPASVADIADQAASMRRQVLLAKVWLPAGLAAAAFLSLVVGAVVYLRRRPRPDATGERPVPPRPRIDESERELVTIGGSRP